MNTLNLSIDVQRKKRDFVEVLISELMRGEVGGGFEEIEGVICEFGCYRNSRDASQLTENQVKQMQKQLADILGSAFYCWTMWNEGSQWCWIFNMRLTKNPAAWNLLRTWCYQGRFKEMTVCVDPYVSVLKMQHNLPKGHSFRQAFSSIFKRLIHPRNSNSNKREVRP
jgi:hypothetical protein